MFNLSYQITVKEKEIQYHFCDLNNDGIVDILDLQIIVNPLNYGQNSASVENGKSDVNDDGVVDIEDISVLLNANNYGMSLQG